MIGKQIILVVIIFMATLSTAHQISAKGHLQNITSQNFQKLFGCGSGSYLGCSYEPNRDWLVMFYAPWCGHCKKAMPSFQQFASKVNADQKSTAKAGLVNCAEQEDICRYFGINGFPTILLLPSNHEQAYEFNGGRTVENFLNFIQDYSQSQLGEKHEIGYTWFKLILDELKVYWKQVLIFGFIIPGAIGYFLAECTSRREMNKLKKQKQAAAKKRLQNKNEKPQENSEEKESEKVELKQKSV